MLALSWIGSLRCRCVREWFGGLTVLCVIAGIGQGPLNASDRPTSDGAIELAQAASKKPTTSNAQTATVDETTREPATVEAAAKALDLRTFPRIEGAKPSSLNTLGMLMYEAPATVKAAYEFQKKQLQERGWKELPNSNIADTSASGHFTKDGYLLAVSASGGFDPQKAGWSNISLVNHGNVPLAKLPMPKGLKPHYVDQTQASYLTDAKVPEMAEASRKLLLDAGWEPYGMASQDPRSPMMHFKKNAIQVMVWVNTAEALGNKTMVRYSEELLQADLPAPPNAPDPDYTDFQKTLRIEWRGGDPAAIADFYLKRLPQQGWKPTTERPIVDDKEKTQFLIFRNEQKDMISLDLGMFTDLVRVEVRHQTAVEVAEGERKTKEAAEREKQRLAKANAKTKVIVPLPAQADKLEIVSDGKFEFQVGRGGGPAVLEFFRKHFTKDGWTNEKEARIEKRYGDIELKKESETLRFRYIDTGVTPVEVSVSGSFRLVLEPMLDKSKPGDDTPKTAAKETKAPNISGVPDINKLLKAVEDANEELSAPKATTKKNAAAAGGAVKAADIPVPKDAEDVEFSKSTKMIKVKSPSDVQTLAKFYTDSLTGNGWEKESSGIATERSVILKFANGSASLSIFISRPSDVSELTLMTKNLNWDVVPPTKVTARKPVSPAPTNPVANRTTRTPTATVAETPTKPNTPRIAAIRMTAADQKQTRSTIWVGAKADKPIKLEYGVAYESRKDNEPIVGVLLSSKPISVEKAVTLLNQDKDPGDALGFDPHMKLRFDAKGKLSYLFMYAEGLSINLGYPGEDKVTAEVEVKDGRAHGQAVMKKPEDFFDKQYRFEAIFDAKLATSTAANSETNATESSGDDLVADDHDGLPFPVTINNRESSHSRYRKSATAVVTADLPSVIAFYRKELGMRGWKENRDTAKVTNNQTQLSFTGAEGSLVVQLERKQDDVTIKLAARDSNKAKAAGILPQPERGRLILGNASDREAVILINDKPYKVAAGLGAKDPKEGTSLNVLPGRYTITIKKSGQADQTEDVRIAVDETWGVIVLPTGGYFADQLY